MRKDRFLGCSSSARQLLQKDFSFVTPVDLSPVVIEIVVDYWLLDGYVAKIRSSHHDVAAKYIQITWLVRLATLYM